MREVFPEVEEKFDYEMPTYKGDGYFIAFAAQKNYSDAGIYCGGLHGRSFIDGFTAGGSAEEKTVCASPQGILGAGP